MHKLMSWAKSHKIAATAVGCSGLVVVGFVLLIILGLILTAAGYEPDEPDEVAVSTQAPDVKPTTSAPAPQISETTESSPESSHKKTSEAPKPTATTQAAEDSDSQAKRVEKTLFEQHGVSSFQELEPTSPGYFISGVEDVGGAVRVHVQSSLLDSEKEEIARWVFNLSCYDVEDLDTVVIRDTSGIDKNYHRVMMDPMIICDVN